MDIVRYIVCRRFVRCLIVLRWFYTQWVFLTPSNLYDWDEAEFTTLFVDFVEHLQKLFVLLVVLVLPSRIASRLQLLLNPNFIRLARVFASKLLTSSIRNDTPNLPFIHYKTLAPDPPMSVDELPYC